MEILPLLMAYELNNQAIKRTHIILKSLNEDTIKVSIQDALNKLHDKKNELLEQLDNYKNYEDKQANNTSNTVIDSVIKNKKINNLDECINTLNFVLKESNEDEFIKTNILLVLRSLIDSGKNNFADISRATQLGRETLYKTISLKGNPHLTTFLKIIRSLGITLEFKKI